MDDKLPSERRLVGRAATSCGLPLACGEVLRKFHHRERDKHSERAIQREIDIKSESNKEKTKLELCLDYSENALESSQNRRDIGGEVKDG